MVKKRLETTNLKERQFQRDTQRSSNMENEEIVDITT